MFATSKILSGVLILSVMALVLWVRLQPLSLDITDILAQQQLEQEVRQRIYSRVRSQFPPEQWLSQTQQQVHA